MAIQEYLNNRQPSIVFNSLIPKVYDAVTGEFPGDVTEIYSFRTGGKTGTIVSTLTLIYEDACKENLVSVESS